MSVGEWCVGWLQWADVLALSGDAADNIPGVKGIGIKTAPKLLQQFGDLESLLANAEQVEKKVKQAEEDKTAHSIAHFVTPNCWHSSL